MKRLPASDLDHILEHTRDLWDELRGERIFITGGTGFFGKWLLESLLWANDRLNLKTRATVLTRSPDYFREHVPHIVRNEAITLLQGDIRNFSFPAGTFSHMIHAASESSQNLNPTQLNDLLNIIVGGTQRTLEFASLAGVKKFLFTSTGAVNGKQLSEIETIPEDHIGEWHLPIKIDFANIYREGKRLGEIECNIFSNTTQVATKIARCFTFVGPYFPLDSEFAIGNFIRDGLKGQTIQIKGDGTPLRSYLYAADLSIWLWVILFRGQTCHPYNTGSDQGISIANLANTVARFITPAPRIEILQTHKQGTYVERYIPSTQRAQTELGLKTWIDFEESIRRTITWYR